MAEISDSTVAELAAKLSVSEDLLIVRLREAGVECKDASHFVTREQREQLLAKLSGAQTGAAVVKKPLTLTRHKKETIKLRSNDHDHEKVVTVVRKKRRVVAPPTAPVAEPIVEGPAPVKAATTAEPALAAEKNPKVAVKAAADIIDSEETNLENTKPTVELNQETSDATTPEKKSDAATTPATVSEADRKKVENAKKKKKKRLEGSDDKENWGGMKRGSSGAGKKDSRKRKPFQRGAPVSNPAQSSKHAFERPTAPVIKEVMVPEMITVSELATRMSIKAVAVIKELMKMGIMVNINQSIDQDTAAVVVEEMGHKAILQDAVSVEQSIQTEYAGESITRAPIVTIMGHVDHGKTSLLDYIRRTRVAAGEAGGITQHIGAYHVETEKGMVTFLDTPGHAAFSAMRSRGARLTDIAVIVVAADDGVKPQTAEAIQHAKAAGVPIVIAINKIDKPDADLDRVRTDLSHHNVISEDWGGDTQFVQVSAKTGQGIDSLLDSILLLAEVLELKAVDNCPASGVVVEASIDKGKGPVATVLVRNGTLRLGDTLLCGVEYGRVRALIDENGHFVESAAPSIPVQVLGLSGAPAAGGDCVVILDERKAREIAMFRQSRDRELRLARQQSSKLENFMGSMTEGGIRTLNIVLKTDVQGSIEALADSLEKLSTDEVKVNLVGRGVGGLNGSDIHLAMASQGFVIGFNVRADASARRLAQQEGITLHYYSIIYDVMDAIKQAVSGLTAPKFREKILGLAQVRDVFRNDKLGAIAGCLVIEGTVKRDKPIRVLRENIVIYEGTLESLRRFKDNVNEVKSGTECGIGVKNYNDVKVGDQIEVFQQEEVKEEV